MTSSTSVFERGLTPEEPSWSTIRRHSPHHRSKSCGLSVVESGSWLLLVLSSWSNGQDVGFSNGGPGFITCRDISLVFSGPPRGSVVQCHCTHSPWLTGCFMSLSMRPCLKVYIILPLCPFVCPSICFLAMFSLSLSVVSVEAACDSVDVGMSVHPDLLYDPLSLLNPLSSLQLYRPKHNQTNNINSIMYCILNHKKTLST